jgi:imidazole glycerol-phosphate synthase subunit HisH
VTVVVVDYGVCNLDSVQRAFEECGAEVTVTGDARALAKADQIVLPGVGSFPVAMKNLIARGLAEALISEANSGAPVLGICLGMQLLATRGAEGAGADGLDLIPGSIERLIATPAERRIPHVGWNEVDPTPDSPLFDGIETGTDFYFVHSYHFRCDDPADVAAVTPYVGGFTSSVRRRNVFGVQFHPEKSQGSGFAVLRNFLGWL